MWCSKILWKFWTGSGFPIYLTRKTVFVYREIAFFSSPFSGFFSRQPENFNSHLIEGIESDHLANTERLEQIAHIQAVNWVRFTFAFVAENSTVVPKPFMHRRKEMPSNTLFSREHLQTFILKAVFRNGNIIKLWNSIRVGKTYLTLKV